MIIYVDVDDTICTGDMYEAAEPLTDNINKVNEMYNEGHEIIYWTARGTLRDGNWFHVTHDQLIDWGMFIPRTTNEQTTFRFIY